MSNASAVDRNPNNIPPVVRSILAEALEDAFEYLGANNVDDPTYADRKAAQRQTLRDRAMAMILRTREIARFIGFDLGTKEDERSHVSEYDPDTDEETTEILSWDALLSRHEAAIAASLERDRVKTEREVLLRERRDLNARLKALASK